MIRDIRVTKTDAKYWPCGSSTLRARFSWMDPLATSFRAVAARLSSKGQASAFLINIQMIDVLTT